MDVFQRVINTGGIFFIENPGQTTYCEECLNSYINPKKYPIGIKAVWVDGIMKYADLK